MNAPTICLVAAGDRGGASLAAMATALLAYLFAVKPPGRIRTILLAGGRLTITEVGS
jgi:hypothetical protein